MKYYRVRKGRNPGIYNSWDECQREIKGFSGQEFKSFKDRNDALLYMNDEEIDFIDSDVLIAYVDGSFNSKTNISGYGVVLIKNEEILEFTGKSEKYPEHRNVSGEIMGTIRAIKLAIEKGEKKLIINYDYEGIRSWALGKWKTNKELTREYKKFFDSTKNQIEVSFIKVKAHSGDYYNERADKLAKKACGIE